MLGLGRGASVQDSLARTGQLDNKIIGASVRGYSTESVAHNPHQLQDFWVTDAVVHLIRIFT